MHRLLLVASLIVIAAALAARWWLVLRILAQADDDADHDAIPPSRRGAELHLQALAQWQSDDPKGATLRNSQLRFGMAVPPLSLLVAIFTAAVGRVPLALALTIPLAATALSVLVGISGLPRELTALSRHISGRNEVRVRADNVGIRCAVAHAWDRVFPAVLRWLQSKGATTGS